MTLQSRTGAVRPTAVNDGKPTQINEHKRAPDERVTGHEPHAMARQHRSPREGRAQ